jgi:phage terminase large subunit-like protein
LAWFLLYLLVTDLPGLAVLVVTKTIIAMVRKRTISVKDTDIRIIEYQNSDYISLTDMIKAKDGDFFISDWLRNRNTVEYIGIWETINNPSFNYGEFAIIKSQAGLHNYKISVSEWVEKLMPLV